MLFKDRLEIWNPGTLPFGLTTLKLRHPHNSIPANPLIAEPMYLSGYIERMGTGTGDIIRLCNEKNLKEPEYIQEENFRTIIWRTLNSTLQVSGEVSGEVSEEVKRVLLVMKGEMKRVEIQNKLNLSSDDYFRVNYILPALQTEYIEMIYPDNPKHRNQQYKLTEKGKILKEIILKVQEKNK